MDQSHGLWLSIIVAYEWRGKVVHINGVDNESVHATVQERVLTARQVQVLQLAAYGMSGRQIARKLGLSVRTVQDHFSAMRKRANARSEGELIACAVAIGLVSPRTPLPPFWRRGLTSVAEPHTPVPADSATEQESIPPRFRTQHT